MDAIITFIIPTIGRITLKDTLLSLINQTNSNWKAIVIFDGIKPTINFPDDRIKIIKSPKLGEGVNSAGNVRNYGIKYVTTPWVAFVDDDDSIKNTYVDTFLNEINENVDVIIFRMLSIFDDIYISLPPNDVSNFYEDFVGISFALKKEIFNHIMFEPSIREDFKLLEKIRENNYKIMISPYLLYFVRNYNHYYSDIFNRVFIN